MSHQEKPASWRRPMAVLLSLTIAISSWRLASAVLVQPHNYLLDDSSLTNQHEQSGSLSPFYNDAQSGPEQQDKDIVSIISDSLTRLRFARMLHQQNEHEQSPAQGLSAEMAELLSEQQAKAEAGQNNGEQASLSSSVASLLMNAVQAAAASAASDEQASDSQQQSSSEPAGAQMSQRGQIMELDTSQAQGAQAAAQPSKSDLKQPIQWYNPKETIPVLKISSMATPSKYKKVYFRSEKKLVDGAFHSPGGSEPADKKPAGLALKSFGHSASSANVQRRSSRGSGSSAPPGVLQDGVIDFLKKFRDVYVQTRPVGSQAAASSSPTNPLNFASSVISAAASSPLASFLAPASNSRPNLMGALSTASQMVSSAQALAQASPASSSASGASSSSGAAGTGATAAGAASAAGSSAGKPLTAQSYVSFWSKTFPTWVRKMLKQMRRRSLYNSSKRQQQQLHAHHHGIGQKSASVPSNLASSSSSSDSSSQASSSSQSNSSS